MDQDVFITFTEARERLAVSKDTLRRIVKREGWTVYSNPRDGREKWLRRAAVERYLTPKPRVSR